VAGNHTTPEVFRRSDRNTRNLDDGRAGWSAWSTYVPSARRAAHFPGGGPLVVSAPGGRRYNTRARAGYLQLLMWLIPGAVRDACGEAGGEIRFVTGGFSRDLTDASSRSH